mmetsp:Transcript_103887/g.320424  ORF Transcript_103887/g.320424 Transcript_103887/m.320424 type:complete len:414 (+) Transcript_103887:520-1761(+)
MDPLRVPQHAPVRDGLYQDLLPGEGHVHEAVHVIIALRVREAFGGDAAAPTGDHIGATTNVVVLVLAHHRLHVSMTRDEQVDAVQVCNACGVVEVVLGRKVRHQYLPLRRGLLQPALEPLQLVSPELCEPVEARVHARGPRGRTAGPIMVVLPAADVVGVMRARLDGIGKVGVEEKPVDGEVRISDGHSPVLRRCHPPIGGPCVTYGLVPGGRELPAAVVMISKHTQPRLAIDPVALVDVLEDQLPLLRGRCDVGWASPTLEPLTKSVLRVVVGRANSPPIEIVPAIDNVVRVAHERLLRHLIGHTLLRPVVGTQDELPVLGAKQLAAGVSRLEPLLAEDAAPIADDEDVVRPVGARGLEAHVRQGDAIVLRGRLGRPRGDKVVAANGRAAGEGAAGEGGSWSTPLWLRLYGF